MSVITLPPQLAEIALDLWIYINGLS
ncbi:uncharacterized protein METZ01_LOCUS171604 [marine metagenome]|uniref:Uncharacterized protein n=1 Tax=marine metagenome TaxID=408172 RepID=A0A382BY67_9ZZZZ